MEVELDHCAGSTSSQPAAAASPAALVVAIVPEVETGFEFSFDVLAELVVALGYNIVPGSPAGQGWRRRGAGRVPRLGVSDKARW